MNLTRPVCRCLKAIEAVSYNNIRGSMSWSRKRFYTNRCCQASEAALWFLLHVDKQSPLSFTNLVQGFWREQLRELKSASISSFVHLPGATGCNKGFTYLPNFVTSPISILVSGYTWVPFSETLVLRELKESRCSLFGSCDMVQILNGLWSIAF